MAYIYSFTDTWTDSGTTYTGLGLDVTNTNSAAGSRIFSFKKDSVDSLYLSKTNKLYLATCSTETYSGQSWLATASEGVLIGPDAYPTRGVLIRDRVLALSGGCEITWSSDSVTPIPGNGANGCIVSDGTGTLAMRYSTNAQKLRVYNTYTDASNYERFAINWATNIMTLATEAAGTGTKRNLVLDSANRSAYIASPSATQVRDILISFGLMAAS